MIATLLFFGCGDAELPLSPEADAQIEVSAIEAEDPARAAIEWFVPSLAGDAGVEKLVAQALTDAHGAGLGRRAAETRSELASMRRIIADRDLPDVFIGIPYVESRLHADVTSPQCAAGPWQFLPEVAVSEGLRVRGCVFRGAEEGSAPWSPGRVLPSRHNRVYLGAGGCRIASCTIDDRRDLARSTRAAMDYLESIGTEPSIAASPHAVPLAVMAFNGGPGTVRRYLDFTEPDDPFAILPACATGDCVALPSETAWYVPRVIAAAAIVACNGADPAEPALADWSRSDLCATLHTGGLAPVPATAERVLVENVGAGLTVGLASLDVAGFGMVGERHAIEQQLAIALGAIPGLRVINGVPGEDAAALVEQGADVVITGEVGTRGERVWVRLATPRPVFALIDVATFDRDAATRLAADVLVGPVRDRSADELADLVSARRAELLDCLPAASQGDRALVTVSIDTEGRATALSIAPARVEAAAAACLTARIESMAFPRELAGAGATLEIALDEPPLADAEDL